MDVQLFSSLVKIVPTLVPIGSETERRQNGATTSPLQRSQIRIKFRLANSKLFRLDKQVNIEETVEVNNVD